MLENQRPLWVSGRVPKRPVFCYECCHGRISSASPLPTSVCPKKRKKSSSSVKLNVELCTLMNMCTQRAGPCSLKWQSKRIKLLEWASMHVFSAEYITTWKEWLCVIDDALEILPWQTPKYGVAYSCSFVLLVSGWEFLSYLVNWVDGSATTKVFPNFIVRRSSLRQDQIEQRSTCLKCIPRYRKRGITSHSQPMRSYLGFPSEVE